MRRSRVGLLWFFGSFATLMSAVGFADGGHQYPSKPADLYRLDLDNAAEGCGADYDGRYRPALTDAPIGKTTAAPITAPSDGLPGSDGWILWPISGSPLAVILYVDDETACQVSCWDGQADSPIDNNVDALEIAAAFGGCIVGPWIDQQAVPADQDFWASDCDDYRCGLRQPRSLLTMCWLPNLRPTMKFSGRRQPPMPACRRRWFGNTPSNTPLAANSRGRVATTLSMAQLPAGSTNENCSPVPKPGVPSVGQPGTLSINWSDSAMNCSPPRRAVWLAGCNRRWKMLLATHAS